jgi:hypothetical protein
VSAAPKPDDEAEEDFFCWARIIAASAAMVIFAVVYAVRFGLALPRVGELSDFGPFASAGVVAGFVSGGLFILAALRRLRSREPTLIECALTLLAVVAGLPYFFLVACVSLPWAIGYVLRWIGTAFGLLRQMVSSKP